MGHFACLEVCLYGRRELASLTPAVLHSGHRRDWCYWSARAALWGLREEEEEEDQAWLGVIRKTKCPGPPSRTEENQCNVWRSKALAGTFLSVISDVTELWLEKHSTHKSCFITCLHFWQHQPTVQSSPKLWWQHFTFQVYFVLPCTFCSDTCDLRLR